MKEAPYEPPMAERATHGNGRLIVVEGIDGSGKTTVAREIADRLASEGRDVRLTQEPTDSFVGTAAREALRDPDHDPVSEALLFAADHAGHVARLRPEIEQGRTIVSDRYSTSWRVYQSVTLEDAFAEGVDPRTWLTDLVEPFELEPDLVLLLDLPVERAIERLDDREQAAEKFEQADFLKAVRGRYIELAREEGFARVDATKPIEATVRDCMEHVQASDGGPAT